MVFAGKGQSMALRGKLSRGEKWIVGLTLAFVVLVLGIYAHSATLTGTGEITVRGGDLLASPAAEEELPRWQVNVNTATVAELQQLSGVGEVLAQRIVAYREEHGAFTSAEELLNVKGIGESKLEKMRDYLEFEEAAE